MTDEEIIRGLVLTRAEIKHLALNALWSNCKTCTYVEHMNAAIKRLEPTARIIQLEAFLYGNPDPLRDGCVWIEVYPCGLAPAFFDCTHGRDVRFLSLYLNANGSHTQWFSGDWYGKTWRCWTKRPTDQQREETKWLP